MSTADLTDQGDLTLHFRINQWLDALAAHYAAVSADANAVRQAMGQPVSIITFEQQAPGKRYSRIVMIDQGEARSVHAFLDPRNGDVYKAAGWKAPAKHVRFNLLDDASFTRLIATCDWSGGYLYIK
jgi:hypothetical protein